MSGVRAAQRIEPEVSEPPHDVQAMVDGLYEILANGVEPEDGKVTLAEIERFLHEHARSAKSDEQVAAFYEQHGLRVQSDSGELSTLELPPLSPPPAQALPPVKLVPDPDALEPKPEPPPLPEPDLLELEQPTGRHPRLERPARTGVALWAGVGVLAAGLFAAVWFGSSLIAELRRDLARAEAKSELQRQVIDNLQGRAAGIESSIQANGELIKRMGDTNTLMLDSLRAREDETKSARRRRR